MSERAPSYVDQRAAEAGAIDLNKIEDRSVGLLHIHEGDCSDIFEDIRAMIAEIRRLRELVVDYYGEEGLAPGHRPNPSDDR